MCGIVGRAENFYIRNIVLTQIKVNHDSRDCSSCECLYFANRARLSYYNIDVKEREDCKHLNVWWGLGVSFISLP